MRMSDQPSIEVETVMASSAEGIYAVITDLELMGEFDTEFRGGSWTSGAPAAVGSTFLGRNGHGDREWETTSTIIAATPGRAYGWSVNLDPDTKECVATWSFALRQVPEGTEVRYGVVLGAAPSGLSARIDKNPQSEAEFIEKRLQMFQENMGKTLEGVRRRASA